MTTEFRVTFQPSGRTVYVLPGTILLEAAARAGLVIDTPCGGAGRCGKCLVRIARGACEPTDAGRDLVGEARIADGFRLACRCRIMGDLAVEIPGTSLFQATQKILMESAAGAADAAATDVAHAFGLAFDIGTTTLVGTLVDIAGGRDLGVAGAVNPQTSYGDDVLSRIKKCREEPGGLQELHDCVLDAVNAIIDQLTAGAGIARDEIRRAVFSGNTAMQQIFCGIDPSALGEIPFTPAFREPPPVDARAIGLGVHPDCEVLVFPQIGGFVGGDTVAGILATRLDRQDTPHLFVDVGTNGEIVLAGGGDLIATSVAAGPAFEGARIRNGMRATDGAIEKVVCDGGLQLNVIGNVKPTGLCGTGLIDAVAVLLRTGLLDETGRIAGPDELPADTPDGLRRRIVTHGDQHDFLLVPPEASGTGEPLFLYQQDIRELQLANGAIRAGIRILLRTAGLAVSDLGGVLIAGAFGNFVRRSNAMRIGMLPALPHEKVRFVGNTAAAGAKRVLLSDAERAYAARIMQETRHIDLSRDPMFQAEFAEAMLFPAGNGL